VGSFALGGAELVTRQQTNHRRTKPALGHRRVRLATREPTKRRRARCLLRYAVFDRPKMSAVGIRDPQVRHSRLTVSNLPVPLVNCTGPDARTPRPSPLTLPHGTATKKESYNCLLKAEQGIHSDGSSSTVDGRKSSVDVDLGDVCYVDCHRFSGGSFFTLVPPLIDDCRPVVRNKDCPEPLTTLSHKRHSERVPTQRSQDVVAEVGGIGTEQDGGHIPNVIGVRTCLSVKASGRSPSSGPLRCSSMRPHKLGHGQ
jgi:hypothetical protein